MRTAVFLSSISLLLLIPAYEPFVAFALQGAVVAGGIQLSRWRNNKTEVSTIKSRFSLATLLQLTTLFAVATAIGYRIYQDDWINWESVLLGGSFAGLLTLLAGWLSCGQGNTRRRIGIGSLLLILFASITYWWEPPLLDSINVLDDAFNVGLGPWPFVGWLLLLSATIAAACLWLCVWRTSFLSLLVLLTTLIVLPSAYVYYRLMTPLPIPEVELPDPNGYDTLVEVGTAIECRAINLYDETPIEIVAKEVDSREELYLKARRALQQQVIYPLEYSFDDIDTDAYSALRTLARAFAARAQVALSREDYGEALNCYLDILQLGRKSSNNGVLVNWLVCFGIKGVGLSGIYNMREHFSSDQCRTLIRKIHKAEEPRESIERMLHRERVWTEQMGGFYGHLTLILEDVTGYVSWQDEGTQKVISSELAESRLLQCELALQVYFNQRGTFPNSLSLLVPSYLEAVPEDPFDLVSDRLRYRLTEDGYLLYSVGPNRLDEGGAAPDPNDWRALSNTGDFRLDLVFAPYEEDPANEDSEETAD